MTPKEKAKELENKFYEICNCTIAGTSTIFRQIGVQAALMAVDEIIDNELLSPQLKRHYILKIPPTPQELEYWQEVKNELLKQQNNG